MSSLNPKTIAKAYLAIVLLLGALVSAPPYSIAALILLVLHAYTSFKPLRARLSLAFVLGELIFTPLALEPLFGLFSAFLVIPALYLLNQVLRENSSNQFRGYSKDGRSATIVLKTFASTLLVVFLSSIVLLNMTLMLTTLVLTGYIAVVLFYVFRKLPKELFRDSKTWSRVVVGNSDKASVNLASKAGISLNVVIKAEHRWVHVEPSEFTLTMYSEAKVGLSFTPPLAGPSRLRLQTLAVDPWGLTQTAQTLAPVDLHIIPRAKYAQWLANKYLEQSAPGTGPTIPVSAIKATKATMRSVEYHGSRQYQPGDRWKDLDWKHTYLLGELIVKEFAGAQGQTAILVANLTAKDAEEVDKLAYNFVMSALTLAMESLPTALAVYNFEEVLAATQPTDPMEALKKVLGLIGKITIVESPRKVLQPAEMLRLKRSIMQLQQVKEDSKKRVLEVLKLEYEANQKAAKDSPASQALAKNVQRTSTPATITVVSSLSSNKDALNITLEKLREKGYNTVQVVTQVS